MLLRLTYLAVPNTIAMLCLLPVSDHGKDIEILVLRHQLLVLELQLGKERARFAPSDPTFLAALLQRLPRGVLRQVRLLVRRTQCCADTVIFSRVGTRPVPGPGARTVRSVRVLVLRLARENPTRGYRRVHTAYAGD
ncbi:hypothetical protein [Streptomyces europaeiscabiei]|uniref:hypothetical protein n=1 Tax=Streptomyces europaeiscabiei TaxID=146819 RepID=UPI0029C00757|nr:hypothetical protein [Streptomyces europaeiscabiei]